MVAHPGSAACCETTVHGSRNSPVLSVKSYSAKQTAATSSIRSAAVSSVRLAVGYGLWTSVGILIFVLGLALIGWAACEGLWVNSAELIERDVRKKLVLAIGGIFLIAIFLAVLWLIP